MSISGTQVFEVWFQRVWKENDSSAIYELFSDGNAEGLMSQQVVGPEQFHAFQKKLSGLVHNIEISIDKSVEDDEWVALLCVLKGNCASTGKAVSMTGTIFGDVQNGQILQAYNHWDFQGLFVQLGLLSEGCFERCLDGESA